MDEPTNQDCIEEADDEISSDKVCKTNNESESEKVCESDNESERDYDTESDNESYVISNYEWVAESASEEEPEEEEFDLLKLMDREIVHESPPTTPNPNPGSPPPALPPPSTSSDSPPFDMKDYLMAGPKKEVQLRQMYLL